MSKLSYLSTNNCCSENGYIKFVPGVLLGVFQIHDYVPNVVIFCTSIDFFSINNIIFITINKNGVIENSLRYLRRTPGSHFRPNRRHPLLTFTSLQKRIGFYIPKEEHLSLPNSITEQNQMTFSVPSLNYRNPSEPVKLVSVG